MLFIVIYHFFIYSIQPNNQDLWFVTNPIIAVLHIGVINFILISGYYGIKFSLEGFLKLIIKCSAYSILIYIAYIFPNPQFFSIKELIRSTIPIQWWFINIYLCLFLLTPIINIPIKKASTEKKLIFIFILFIVSFCFQFCPSLSDGKNCVNFILIYYIGNFTRHNLKIINNMNIINCLSIYILFNIFIVALYLLLSYTKFYGELMFSLIFPYNSIGLIINSLLFANIFNNLNIKSQIINYLSVSILPIYLITENNYIGIYLYKFANNMKNYTDSPVFYGASWLLLVASICIVCIIVDKIINPLLKTVENSIFETQLFKRVNNKVNIILNNQS